MRRLLLLGMLLMAWPALATVTWTCTRDADFAVSNGRVAFGLCIATGTYAQGGDPLGTAADPVATALAVCGHAGSLKSLVVSSMVDRGADTGLAAAFDHTAMRMQLFTATAVPGATARLIEFGAGATASLELRYVAFCS